MPLLNMFALGFQTLFVMVVVILLLIPLSKKIGLTDEPCSRKQHNGHIPLIGGLAIYLSAIIISSFAFDVSLIDFAPYVAASTIILIVGLFDDYKHLDFKIRFLGQVLACLIMVYWARVEITSLGNLFGLGSIELGILSAPFTVFAIVGAINSFNMLDGIDGLVAGIALVSFIAFAIIFGSIQNWQALNFCIVLISTIIGFLVFNLRIKGRGGALIFLGDNGSTLIGFTICWLAIDLSQPGNGLNVIKPVTILWLLAVPLYDTVSIIIRRIKKGKSPFAPDREHLHHIFTVAGYSVNQTVFVIISLAFILTVFGMSADLIEVPQWIMFYLFMSLFSLYLFGMSHAWKLMKFARYLRTKEQVNRRKMVDRRVATIVWNQVEKRQTRDRRSGDERRFIPTEKEHKVFLEQNNCKERRLRLI